MTTALAPMTYVACLAAYNHGILHGRWIDADQSEHDLQTEVFDMLKQSPIADAEEWAIHDYQDFGELSLCEYTGLAEVSELANLIGKHGRPYSAFAAYYGVDYAAEEAFEDAYCGEHESSTHFASELFDETYPDFSEPLRFYIDDELFARDLFINDYLELDSPGGIYVFRNQ